MKNKFLLIILLYLNVFTFNNPLAQSLYSKGVLNGLDLISKVLVEDIDEDLQKDGLNEKFIQTTIELKLRQVGIKIGISDPLEGFKYKSTRSLPTFYIVINSIKNPSANNYSLSISLMLNEYIKLLRNIEDVQAASLVSATTWKANILAVKPINKVYEVETLIKDLCDIFINDYLSENP